MVSVGGFYKQSIVKGILEKMKIRHELDFVYITSDGRRFLNKKDAIQERLTDLTMKIDEDLRTNNVDVYERAHFIKLNARIKKELKKMSTIDAFYEQMAKTFPAILPPDRVFP